MDKRVAVPGNGPTPQESNNTGNAAATPQESNNTGSVQQQSNRYLEMDKRVAVLEMRLLRHRRITILISSTPS